MVLLVNANFSLLNNPSARPCFGPTLLDLYTFPPKLYPYQFGDGERLALDQRLGLRDVGAEERSKLFRVDFGEEVLDGGHLGGAPELQKEGRAHDRRQGGRQQEPLKLGF